MEKYKEKESINNRIMLLNKENESIQSRDKIFYSGLRKNYIHDIQYHKELKNNEKQNDIYKEKYNLNAITEKIKQEDQRRREEKYNQIQQQYKEMEDHKRIKMEINEREKMTDYYINKKNFEEFNKQFRDHYGEMKMNLDNKNAKVYNNMSKYSDYIKKIDNDNQVFYNNDKSYAVSIDPKQVSWIIHQLKKVSKWPWL